MTATSDHTPLEFLVRQADERDANPIVLLPQAPGSGADAIARSLVENLEEGHWRLLPAPGARRRRARAARLAPRRLAGDVGRGSRLGRACDRGDRRVPGPVLADAARTVVLVRDPLAGAALTGEPVPKRRGLWSDSPRLPRPRFRQRARRIANPQSRALLGTVARSR